MAKTYESIASQTLVSNQNIVTFNSITSAFTNLRLIIEGTGSTTVACSLRFNSDAGSNYSYVLLYGSGTSPALSTRSGPHTELYLGNIWTTISNVVIDIPGYTGTVKKKTAMSRANNAANRVAGWIGTWTGTSAITRIDITTTGSDTYQTGTTFTLQGIKAA